jgi:protein-disulfide isomerase
MHDQLFAETAELDAAGIGAIAESLGIDTLEFHACTSGESVADVVSRDLDDAKKLGLGSTPSFFLGTRLPDNRVKVQRAFAGALPVGEFTADLDSVLDGDASISFWRRLFSRGRG